MKRYWFASVGLLFLFICSGCMSRPQLLIGGDHNSGAFEVPEVREVVSEPVDHDVTAGSKRLFTLDFDNPIDPYKTFRLVDIETGQVKILELETGSMIQLKVEASTPIKGLESKLILRSIKADLQSADFECGFSETRETAEPIESRGGNPASYSGGGSFSIYVVKEGDTLSEIALRFKKRDTVEKIMARNKILNPDKIFVGQKLKIAD